MYIQMQQLTVRLHTTAYDTLRNFAYKISYLRNFALVNYKLYITVHNGKTLKNHELL